MDNIQKVNNILNGPPKWDTFSELFVLINTIAESHEINNSLKGSDYMVYLLINKRLYPFVKILYQYGVDIVPGLKTYLSINLISTELLTFIIEECNIKMDIITVNSIPFFHYMIRHKPNYNNIKIVLSKQINVFIEDSKGHNIVYYISAMLKKSMANNTCKTNSVTLNKIVELIQKKYPIEEYPIFWKPYMEMVFSGFYKNLPQD